MKRYFIIFGLIISVISNAQTYKKHTVLAKETLYGISKLYHVSTDKLEELNIAILKNGLQIGQVLNIPESIMVEDSVGTKQIHVVFPKENLFSIATLYNVSVQDLENLNKETLKNGLQIGARIIIPNKKKTLNGQARIINSETIFHIVAPKETKYSIAKNYHISIEQLESQNPEIINGLIEGHKLAINTKKIEPKNDSEELMIALAEKQAMQEKNKAKTIEIEDLQDKLTVQKQMNQKVLKVNSLRVNLNNIDETKGGSAEKLKLVLEANKNIQEILISKLDSLVIIMGEDLVELKNTEILDLEESKILEKESAKNMTKSAKILQDLKQDLADNRKIYTSLMNKVQRINYDANHEYKKKVHTNYKTKEASEENTELLEVIKQIQIKQETNELQNKKLISKIDSLEVEKKLELKRRINKATFYSSEAREYDDKLAQVKLKRYQTEAVKSKKENNTESNPEKVPSNQEIRKELNNEVLSDKKIARIEVLKNLKEVPNGFYLIADSFNEAIPRDIFARKLIDSGELKTNFFYNINIFKYYVYTKKLDTVDQALYEYNKQINNSLFQNMFIVHINNTL